MLSDLNDDAAWDDLRCALDEWKTTRARWEAEGKWNAAPVSASEAAPAKTEPPIGHCLSKPQPEIIKPASRRIPARKKPTPHNGHVMSRGP